MTTELANLSRHKKGVTKHGSESEGELGRDPDKKRETHSLEKGAQKVTTSCR